MAHRSGQADQLGLCVQSYGAQDGLRVGRRFSLGEYFRFYNEERLHQALGYRTPAAVYQDRASTPVGHA